MTYKPLPIGRTKSRILRATKGDVVAHSTWVYDGGVWSLRRADDELMFIVCCDAKEAAFLLKKRGWTYEWLKEELV